MCGIAGFYFKGEFTNEEKEQWIRHGFNSIVSRGRHATGFMNLSLDGKYHIFKVGKSWEEAKKLDIFKQELWRDVILLHTRAATHGSPKDNNNNHPHESEDWIIVHNGVISSRPLAEYNYKGECDSEVLLSYIQMHGLQQGLAQAKGSMAIAAYHKTEPGVLYLYRESNPIIVQEKQVGKNKYIVAFSSLGLSWMDIRGKYFHLESGSSLDSNSIYKLDFIAERVSLIPVSKVKIQLFSEDDDKYEYISFRDEIEKRQKTILIKKKQDDVMTRAGIVYGD